MATWREIAFKSDVDSRTLNFFSSGSFPKGFKGSTGSGGAAAGEFGYMHFIPIGNFGNAGTPLELTLSSDASATDGEIVDLDHGIDTTGSTSTAASFTLDYNDTMSGGVAQTGWCKGVLGAGMEVPYGDSSQKIHHFDINLTICNDHSSSAQPNVKFHFSLWRAYTYDNNSNSALTFYKVQDLVRANTGSGLFYAPFSSGVFRHFRAEPFDIPIHQSSDHDEYTCIYVLGCMLNTSSENDTDDAISSVLSTDWPQSDSPASIKVHTVVKYYPADWP